MVLSLPACSGYKKCMQYTLRNIPPGLDRALRRRAREQGKSLNDTAIDALQRGVGGGAEPVRHRSLRDLAGTWIDDPDFDAAIVEQDRIEPHLWR